METITLTRVNVLKAYKNATKDQKKFLSDLVGDFIDSGKIMDRIKTFEDACAELGLDPDGITNNYPPDALDFKKACIICRALNEEWVPDWENSNEYKWSPYFDMRSGFGFSVSCYTYTYPGTCVGSRLCFKSEELAKYAGKQFEAIYKGYLTF